MTTRQSASSDLDVIHLPRTRAAAKAVGSPVYWPGHGCRKARHQAPWLVRTAQCVICVENQRQRLKDLKDAPKRRARARLEAKRQADQAKADREQAEKEARRAARKAGTEARRKERQRLKAKATREAKKAGKVAGQ